MKVSRSDPAAWSRGRWWAAFAIALVVQMLLIGLLSDRRPIVPRLAEAQTSLQLVADPPPDSAIGALMSIDDPTLFALPGVRGFSGAAWLRAPSLVYRPMDWSEPARWLTQNVEQLGAAFAELIRTNPAPHRAFGGKPGPRPGEVAVPPVALPTKSSFRIEGELAGRELITLLEVPSFPHTDILANTVIQLVANRSGFVFSPPIALSGSGSKAADERAVELARSLRFKPVAAGDATSLTWGKLVVQWHTLEMPATNRPAVQQPP
jgi:hypothetical protein